MASVSLGAMGRMAGNALAMQSDCPRARESRKRVARRCRAGALVDLGIIDLDAQVKDNNR